MPDSPSAADSTESVDTTVTTTENTAPVTETTEGSSAAESPPAKAVSMLDTVNAALKPTEASPPSQTPDQDDDESDPAASVEPDSDEAKDELSDKELSALSDRVKRRFGRLSSTLKAKDTELSTLRPKAEKIDQIYAKIAQAGLDGEDADRMIQLGSLIKGHPAKALEALRPLIQALEAASGDELAPELKERVRLGYLTHDDAIALSRANAAAAHANRTAEQLTESQRAQAQERELGTLVSTSIAAVEKWEKAKSSKDPDWTLKRDEVAEQVQLAIQSEALKRGVPYFPNATEAVKLSEDALKKINGRFKRFKPASKEIIPNTSGVSPRSKVAPKNTLDIINNVLAAS